VGKDTVALAESRYRAADFDNLPDERWIRLALRKLESGFSDLQVFQSQFLKVPNTLWKRRETET